MSNKGPHPSDLEGCGTFSIREEIDAVALIALRIAFSAAQPLKNQGRLIPDGHPDGAQAANDIYAPGP